MADFDTPEIAVQREKRREALAELRHRLLDCGNQMEAAHRSAVLGQTPDLSEFFGSVDAVRRAEEALDLAELDLRTASGQDA